MFSYAFKCIVYTVTRLCTRTSIDPHITKHSVGMWNTSTQIYRCTKTKQHHDTNSLTYCNNKRLFVDCCWFGEVTRWCSLNCSFERAVAVKITEAIGKGCLLITRPWFISAFLSQLWALHTKQDQVIMSLCVLDNLLLFSYFLQTKQKIFWSG